MPSVTPVESPVTVNFNRIGITDPVNLSSELRDSPYSEDSAFGFRIINEGENYLVGELISNTHNQITRFDPDIGELVEENLIGTQETKFRIDFDSEILEVYSDKDATGELINRLGQVIPRLTIRDLDLNIESLVNQLEESEFETEFSSVRINNVSPEPDTSGNCYLNTFSDEAAKSILNKYSTDITYLGTTVELTSEDVTLGFYRSGSVRIFSNSGEDKELFQLIRHSITEVVEDA